MSRAVLLSATALALAGCGGGTGERPRDADPFAEIAREAPPAIERASPRWERLDERAGEGPAEVRSRVARGAIQWRARYRCERGRLELSLRGRSLADVACPRAGEVTGVRTGELPLAVDADARWRLVLEQQVDTPLREAPLAPMRAPGARVLAEGRFYGIERRGRGGAVLYRLPDGRLALRFDGFSTAPNTDLFVWLSRARRPRTSVEAARSPHTVLRELKSTAGEQNYLIPKGVDPDRIRSVVIWCVPVRIAYAAATLRRP